MFPIIPSNGTVTGFQIANSLRFRSSASAYLNRTPSVAGNRQTWTWSGWVKLGSIGTARSIFSCGADGSNYTAIDWRADNRIQLLSNTAGIIVGSIVWDPYVWRDPSAWYHLVIVCDTTNATQTSRFRFYMNGVQYTGISSTAGENTYPAQNANTNVNNTVAHSLGRKQHNASEYFDGYLTEINFIDGQALTPSSFGEIDAVTGVWKPKRYSGTYGTNGFYLNFSNGTSTTTLGYDSSSNGNNWTTNNISLTSGATYDWMIDSPTSFAGSSYGVGNYCVLNPLGTTFNGGTLSEANLKLTSQNAGSAAVTSGTIGVSNGKYYFEVEAVSNGGFGQVSLGVTSTVKYAGAGGDYTAYGTYGVAFDVVTGYLWIKDSTGVWVGSGNPVTGVNPTLTFTAGATVFPSCIASRTSGSNNSGIGVWNFGQRPFAYTPPSGYKSLCTQNLPVATIYNGAQYMAATTYTGNGSTQSVANTVNGVSFQPDFVWTKSRSAAESNRLFDSVRGAQKVLYTNNTNAEGTETTSLLSFDSGGFSLGSGAPNTSTVTYIGWQWKAGGTAVTNTAGSITSQVSANTTAGFSVVTYTGTGANATVGHGLGVAPSMVIFKKRNTAVTPGADWSVYHVSIGPTASIKLNLTNTSDTNSVYFNNTAPTSSVFSVGSTNDTNISAGTYVAYCFAAIAGYSAFGSYTGNGSADGPFIYTGFRPRFVLVKCSSTTGNWALADTSRLGYNKDNNPLYANLSNVEGTDDWIDITANGFKIRSSTSDWNTNAATYIFAAFAENPFQNALAR